MMSCSLRKMKPFSEVEYLKNGCVCMFHSTAEFNYYFTF
uniref:Uncharacterized protein n=1 Tax=Anguilla anguilla TaxID=7936 RepID=A0A0E9SVZ3_ANGAN